MDADYEWQGLHPFGERMKRYILLHIWTTSMFSHTGYSILFSIKYCKVSNQSSPYSTWLLHWHRGNYIVPVLMKIFKEYFSSHSINSLRTDDFDITTTKQSTTKPYARAKRKRHSTSYLNRKYKDFVYRKMLVQEYLKKWRIFKRVKPKNDMMFHDIYNCICQNTKK